MDFENAGHTAKNYSVVVRAKATDASPAISQLFVLSLGNGDEATSFVATTTGSAMSENNAVGVVVGNFLATDGDGAAVTYGLGGTDANYFTIDSTGKLKLTSRLDYEDAGHTAQNYTVVVTAKSTDASSAISQVFVLSLGNADEATGFVATTRGGAISENNVVDVVVGNFLATDGDGAAVTYSLGGTDANYFTIDATGNLKLTSILDFEDVAHTAKNYSVVITAKATDASPAISQLFVLSLGNGDEATGFVAAPTGGVDISENNAVGIVVGNFLATDGDGAKATYSLGGTDANYFTIDSTGNLKLKSVLDFENAGHTAKNYSVVVMAKSTDASPAISQLFVLTLGNVDDPTSFIATTTGAAVTENNTVGVVVANFLATDGDGASVTYDLSGADANYFTIDATGKLKLNSSLDFEDANHT
ncbi:MAG: cadherin repeat domain-containing protein, partial [Rhodoferax sp.]|nr:cadherin repeat domain-containing protein [Rhodoferax sp.]